MKKELEHCCKFLEKSLEDGRIGIDYNSIRRTYSIYSIFSNSQDWIDYCPFCGEKLPKKLSSIYDKILKKEFDVDDAYDEEEMKNVPSDFYTDEWWKKRGL